MLDYEKELSVIDNMLRGQKSEHIRYDYRHNFKRTLINRLRTVAKNKGLDFNLSEDDLIIPEHCPILGIKLTINNGYRQDNSPSIDRIDNSKGYVKGNIHFISNRANRIKSDSTPDELYKIANYIHHLLIKERN